MVDWDVKHQDKNKQIKDKIHLSYIILLTIGRLITACIRPADKRVQLEINFLISQLKQMLWAHKTIVLM